jgi:hypothetical protein
MSDARPGSASKTSVKEAAIKITLPMAWICAPRITFMREDCTLQRQTSALDTSRLAFSASLHEAVDEVVEDDVTRASKDQ